MIVAGPEGRWKLFERKKLSGKKKMDRQWTNLRERISRLQELDFLKVGLRFPRRNPSYRRLLRR